MRLETIPLLLCVTGAMALAQFPGQYPPGQYPPGQYPPGQSGNCPPGQYPPCNNRRQPTDATPGRSSKNSKNNKSTSTGVVTTTIGIVRRAVPNQVVIEPADHRIIWYRVSSTTKFMKNNKEVDSTAFAVGDHVTLDSTADDEEMYTAVEVRWDKEGTPEERAKAPDDWDLPKLVGGPVGKGGSAPVQREPGDDRPVLRRANSGDDAPQKDAAPAASAPQTAKTQAPPPEPEDNRPSTMMKPPDPPKDADDPGPPSLRRGVPSTRQMADLPPPRYEPLPDAPAKAPSAPNAPKQTADAPAFQGKPVDPVIEKAREAAATYLSSLPNYFCQQMTARYQSDHPKSGWDALDVVTADVAYQDGHESYTNIKVGNKAVKTSMEDIGGTRSTGEFSSILEDLLSPYTDAMFRRTGTDTL